MTNYPCAECHSNVPVKKPEGEIPRPHSSIKMKHMPNARHCYLCHDKTDRNKLRLISGQSVSFNDTPRLCGQCHPSRKRDWDRGIHGKHVGSWRGTSHRYSCSDCHDPHAPKRGTVRALPPPPFPKFGVRKQAH